MIDQAVLDLHGGFFMTPWRHLRGYAGAGWFIDHGVHRTHWMLEVLGPCKSVYARTRQLEAVRKNERWGEVPVDTEDLALATLEFESGALCQFSVASGGRGDWHFQVDCGVNVAAENASIISSTKMNRHGPFPSLR